MRRWQLCLALSFLTPVVYVPAAEAALAPPAIVSGVLVDSGDNPVAGNLQLFAWPTGRPVEVGQTLDLLPVGQDRAGEGGRFSVHGEMTPQLAELARLNGGYINFVLQAAARGVIEETHFSRYVGEAPMTGLEAEPRKRRTEWRADPEANAEPVQVKLPKLPEQATAAGDRRISPMQGGCYGLKLVGTEIGHTVIGELRTPHDTLEAVFTYGKRADSEIGVAARASRGPWDSQGSFHVANSEDTSVEQRADSRQHLLVTSRFMYEKYEHTCPTGRREKVVPREWMGDVQSQPTAARGCGGVPEERLGRYTPRTSFTRDRERAVQWESAVSVFGASLTARSGYSRYVRGRWQFGAAPMHVLCGDDGPPKRAGHIFAEG